MEIAQDGDIKYDQEQILSHYGEKKTCFLSSYRCLVEHCDHLNGESAKGGDIKYDPVPIISFKKTYPNIS